MAQAYAQVLVDWDDDDNFTGTYDDITSDIKTMSFNHTRQPESGYMNGAILNIQVNNNDNKYSPPYASSPLANKLVSGHKLVCRVWYPYDHFNDTADTNLTSHTIPYDSNFSWTASTGAIICHATSNSYAKNTGGANAIYTTDMGESELDIAMTATTSSSTASANDCGLILRYVDANNYAYATIDTSANTIHVNKVISGSTTSIGTASYSWGASTKHTLSIRMHGTSFKIFVDDVLQGTVGLDDSAINSATKHGIFINASGSDVRIHDFGGLKPLFRGKLKEIRPRPSKGLQYAYLKGFDTFEDFKLIQSYARIAEGTDTRTAGSATSPFRRILTIGEQTDNHAEDANTDYQIVTKAGYTAQFFSQVNLLDGLYRVQDTEDGFIYVDGHGYFHFEGRFHRSSAPHTTAVATFRDSYNGTDAGYHNYAYDDGINGVFNVIECGYRVGNDLRTASSNPPSERYTDGWTAMDTDNAGYVDSSAGAGIPIKAGEQKTFLCKSKFQSDDEYGVYLRIPGGVQNIARASVTSNDAIQIWTGSDATGTQLAIKVYYDENDSTADTSGKFGGNWQQVTVTNNDTSDGYITRFFLAQAGSYLLYQQSMAQAKSTYSVNKYGERKLTLPDTIFSYYGDSSSQLTGTGAIGSAIRKLEKLIEPIVRMRVDMVNQDKPTLMNQVHRKLSDRVDVIESDMGMNFPAYINGYTYNFSNGNTVLETTFDLTMEGVGLGISGVWNTAKWNFFSWS
tara:strand:+ start:6448 stop:8664 length:2217 start_codon:yes stop_codon:yes gene_type:complete